MSDALIATGAVAIGIVLMVIGTVLAIRTRHFRDRAEPADGTVIDVVTTTSKDMDQRVTTTRQPVVQFTTATGTRVSFRSSYSASSVNRIGASVPVLYDPDHPRNARIATFASLYLATSIVGGIGIVLTLCVPLFLL